MDAEHFWFLFSFLREVEKGMTKDEMKQVMIGGLWREREKWRD